MKQIIEIKYDTLSYSEQFHVLHVWKTDAELIVSSIRYIPGIVADAGSRVVDIKIPVDVERVLPVKHYVVMPDIESGTIDLGDINALSVKREDEIPENERQHCLYENPTVTDLAKRIEFVLSRVSDAIDTLEFYNKARRDQLYGICNDPEAVRRIIASDNHTADEQIVLLQLSGLHQYLVYVEEDGQLNEEEVNELLAKNHLTREDSARLVEFGKKYEHLYDENLRKFTASLAANSLATPKSEAKPQNDVANDTSVLSANKKPGVNPQNDIANNTSVLSANNLKQFGMFAGAVAVAVGVACTIASRVAKP